MSIRQKEKRAMKLLQKRANQQQQKMMQRRRVNLQKVQLPKMKNLLKLQREKTGKPLHRILKLNKQKQKQLRVNLQKQQRVSLKRQNKELLRVRRESPQWRVMLRLELRLQKEK